MPESFFPKFVRQRQTGEVGINAVSSIVNDKFKWIFRRVNAEHDFGVDGYIDVVTDDGNVTGQSVAVQIKAGASFFRTKTAIGFVFYGETKHLNYYLNLRVPIIIVLYDEKKHTCYWEQFDIRKTEPTEKGWKIGISKRSNLSSSKDELIKIVGPATEHADAIKSHWAMNQMMAEFDFILYAVDRADIENKNTNHIREFRDRIYLNETLCRKLQGRVEVTISGYDEDPRELWEIPEVIRWYQAADDPFKYWFFFMDARFRAHGLKSYFSCLCDAKREKIDAKTKVIEVSLNRKKLKELFELNFVRLNELTERLGMSIEQSKTITFAVFDVMKIPHGD